MNHRDNCPVCGRQWRPHYRRPGERDFYLPAWRRAEWFHVVCGSCGEKFMSWLGNSKYYNQVGRDAGDPDKSFLTWVVKQFKRDINHVVAHGHTIRYCSESTDGNLLWCRYRVRGDDSMCEYHRNLVSPEIRAARKAAWIEENARIEQEWIEESADTILDRLCAEAPTADDITDAIHEIERLRAKIEELQSKLAASQPHDRPDEADGVNKKRA